MISNIPITYSNTFIAKFDTTPPKHSASLPINPRFNYMMVLLVLIFLLNLQPVRNHEYSAPGAALKFGKDAGSYIYMGTVDFSAMEEAFTICSWVRRMSNHQGTRQDWLSYSGSTRGDHELFISDSSYSGLFYDVTTYTQPTLTVGNWNHMCFTFSYSTRTKRMFYNGEQIGQETTPAGRKLDRTGSLMFGNFHYKGAHSAHDSVYFGGELYDTNFLSIELSADQIKDMYNEGRCSNYSQTFADNTVLSWEDILDQQRTGSVTEISLEACNHTHPTEEISEESTEESTEENTVWDFLRGKEFYNLLISEEMLSKTEERFEILAEFTNHTIDDALILHLEKHHSGQGNETETDEESEDEDPLERVRYWKFLTGRDYYEELITDSLVSGMKSQLELLAEFLGHRIDDPLIEHLIKHHSEMTPLLKS